MSSRFKQNPATVNVFANPGEDRIKVMPRKSARNSLKTKNTPAKSGDKTMPNMTAKVADFHSRPTQDPQESPTRPGGAPVRIGSELVVDFSAGSKEAAMEKEAIIQAIPMAARLGGRAFLRSRAGGAGLKQATNIGLQRGTQAASRLGRQPINRLAGSQPVKKVMASQPVQKAQQAWGSAAGQRARGIGRKVLQSGGGALQGSLYGYGADVANRFLTGNESNFGLYGAALGALGPAGRAWMARNPGMFSRLNTPYGRLARRKAHRVWSGDSLIGPKGLSGRLNDAALLGTVGMFQQGLTSDKVPGGFNFSNPVGTATNSAQVSRHMLAQKLGFNNAQELEQVMAMIGPMVRGAA